MPAYNDPTVLHEAECYGCGRIVRDHEQLDDNLNCPTCQADTDDDEADDGTLAARARELLDNARANAAARKIDLMGAIFDIAGTR